LRDGLDHEPASRNRVTAQFEVRHLADAFTNLRDKTHHPDLKRREQPLWLLATTTFLVFFQAYMIAPLIPRLAAVGDRNRDKDSKRQAPKRLTGTNAAFGRLNIKGFRRTNDNGRRCDARRWNAV
jgi:hypothetical protein